MATKIWRNQTGFFDVNRFFVAFSEKLNFNVKQVIASNFVAFTEYMNFRFGCNMFFKIPKQKNANF